jgi:hypothetical protein
MMSDNGNCGLLFEAGNKKDLLETLKNSHELSIETKRPAVLKQFEKELSFEAIAGKMIEAISAAHHMKSSN